MVVQFLPRHAEAAGESGGGIGFRQLFEQTKPDGLESNSFRAAPVSLYGRSHARPVVRKNNSALRISTIRAIGSDVRSTLRVGRIADVTSAESRRNNVTHQDRVTLCYFRFGMLSLDSPFSPQP